MINSLKDWLYEKAIKDHKLASRDKVTTVNDGHKILLIGNFNDRKEISSFMDKLRNLGKRPKALYYSGKLADVGGDTFSDNEINWYGLPNSANIGSRLSTRYDICIFLDFQFTKFYEYILRVTQADLFIGPMLRNIEPYLDLIIDGNHQSVDKLIEDIEFHINKLSVQV